MKLKLKFAVINNLLGLFVLILSVGFAGIFVLAWFIKIDVTASGEGIVKCRNWIDIKPEIKGIVRAMSVREGQWVQMGEMLFSLEDRERQLEVKQTELKIAELELNIAKFRRTYILSSESIISETKEAKARLDAAEANYRLVCKGPKPEEIRLAKSKILRAQKQFAKSTKDFELTKEAFDIKVVSRLEVEQSLHVMNLAEVDLRMARDELLLIKNRYDANQIAAAKAEVDCKKAILKKVMARENELYILSRDLDRTIKQKVKEERRLAVLNEHLKLTRLKAPIDGYILTHDTEHLLGKAVNEGEIVLRIGDYKEYVIDCRVSENDFPLVKVGQAAKIQIKPFPKGEYRLFSAEVVRVGADVKDKGIPKDVGLMDKMTGLLKGPQSLKAGLFPVILRLERPYNIEIFGDVYHIKPGFSAEVEIITRQERIVDYLLRRVLRIKGKLSPDNIHF